MEATAIRHFEKAGRTIDFQNNVDLGHIRETGDKVVWLRSYDIPVEVISTCDVGLCGSDWVEEKKLEHGINPVVLGSYGYGRHFNAPSPRLELVTDQNNPASCAQDIEPGSIIVTEEPRLTRKFLEGLGLKVAHLGQNHGAPLLPREFSRWCKNEGFIGLRSVHGREAGLIHMGSEFGVMVNERGDKLNLNGLKVVEILHEIKTLLIADQEALRVKGNEVYQLRDDLDAAYLSITQEFEARNGSPER